MLTSLSMFNVKNSLNKFILDTSYLVINWFIKWYCCCTIYSFNSVAESFIKESFIALLIASVLAFTNSSCVAFGLASTNNSNCFLASSYALSNGK